MAEVTQSGKGESIGKVILLLGIMGVAVLSGCATAKLGKSDREKLKGKTIVIIGASSGLGKGVALQLARYNANVVLAARRKEQLEEVGKEVRLLGGNALVVQMDVSKPEDIDRLANEVIAQFGTIDVWINNAGIGAIGRFWEIPVEEHSRLVDINLKGVMYGSHMALRIFRAQGFGTLINTGSTESEVPLAYHASYASTKAAIRSLGEVLHQELRLSGNKNIRVVTIMPWGVDTPFWQHAANHSGGTPRMGFMDGPEKVVNAIVYATLHRRRELPVGWKARTATILHRMFPHLVEGLSADLVHKYQIDTAPPTPATSGSLFKPMESGTGIDDGVRQRIKRENKELRRRKNGK